MACDVFNVLSMICVCVDKEFKVFGVLIILLLVAARWGRMFVNACSKH